MYHSSKISCPILPEQGKQDLRQSHLNVRKLYMGHNGLNEYGTTATVKATKVYIPVTLSLYDDARLENTIKTNQIMIK